MFLEPFWPRLSCFSTSVRVLRAAALLLANCWVLRICRGGPAGMLGRSVPAQSVGLGPARGSASMDSRRVGRTGPGRGQ
eukprot:6199083-Pyramimonas_sp.AAC.1